MMFANYICTMAQLSTSLDLEEVIAERTDTVSNLLGSKLSHRLLNEEG